MSAHKAKLSFRSLQIGHKMEPFAWFCVFNPEGKADSRFPSPVHWMGWGRESFTLFQVFLLSVSLDFFSFARMYIIEFTVQLQSIGLAQKFIWYFPSWTFWPTQYIDGSIFIFPEKPMQSRWFQYGYLTLQPIFSSTQAPFYQEIKSISMGWTKGCDY